ncbi:MAG: glycogen synthase GlgA [Sideroxydans sp.]|nr:glycogen synthase GlgA [Sideroxydans sp.]
MHILFVTSEIYPLIKTGGLADVSGSLPLALRKLGADVRVLIPGYPSVLEKLQHTKVLAEFPSPAGNTAPARLLSAVMPDTALPLLVLDCPVLYNRSGGPYLAPTGRDWPDNAQRFGFLNQIGALLAGSATPLSWRPDVVHCNDWQSALIPALLHYSHAAHARSVVSVHNLAFQGNFDAQWIPRLGLPAASYQMHGVEFYGHFSFLKAGLYYADKITTVSRTYAAEIQTPEFGCGMEGLLQERHADLAGIVNGIDDDWNPARDSHLQKTYDYRTLGNKAANKLALQQELGLEPDADAPLLGLVSRLTHQKGIDLVLDCVHDLLQDGAQLAVLGTGETQFEHSLNQLVRRHPGRVSATIGYDEGLAHRVIAGSDIFLMPSRFEPCGLSQMYAMAYGTPPVVRRTGGLADTVTDCNAAALRDGSATGFVFEQAGATELLGTIRRALSVYRTPETWNALQSSGMQRDFSWQHAAEQYLAAYRSAMA